MGYGLTEVRYLQAAFVDTVPAHLTLPTHLSPLLFRLKLLLLISTGIRCNLREVVISEYVFCTF